ncbi:DegT/DnrJ/EryC1/StrS family aminotransferase [Bacillus benzoevorans]|uniref:dTDP-4-amino-4,6-dideoxygalactose transaminase n=1 Tax=Bacillus benzoevorans TaxID=1456 RepID=A0A7X0LXW3_9BACI|nr:DegT/DnrJ/EryC1/StrS aminotransferase family protein [Bacillus benzoevorans]MBB6446834.1 dTDP-4-amino-4,6-dideoxygalactose transaminase [Bacillus benzoevorans]
MLNSNNSELSDIWKLIPFSPPDITDHEINEVIDTLKSGWITTGPKTKEFERQIARWTNTSKAVCLNSATAAMELTLRILGVGEGDEVITSAYTYTSTASVIHHVGAKIVLVDTAKDSFLMNYEQLENAITSKTKVIIAVDIGGVMCDYDKIFAMVKRKKGLFHPSNDLQKAFGRVVVLADAAHSFGAVYKGYKSGGVADFTCFSFHAVKNLTTGEGGAVTWRDIPDVSNEEIYQQYMLFSLHGQSKDALAKTRLGSWEYDILYPAYKSNMTDIMASIGLAQLKRYESLLARRREIIELYDRELADEPLDILTHYDADHFSSGHLYLVRLRGKDETFRNYVMERMAEKGIATNVHFKPLPMHSAYKNLGFDIKDFPNAYDVYRNELTLPLYTSMDDEDVKYVCRSLKAILDESHG